MAPLRRHTPALWLIAAVVLMVRALVPSGWMPSVEQDGGIRILLCTGQGTTIATLTHDGNIKGGDDGESSTTRETCPYGVIAQPFDVPDAIALPEAQPAPDGISQPRPVLALIVARKGLRPPARGPPAFV